MDGLMNCNMLSKSCRREELEHIFTIHGRWKARNDKIQDDISPSKVKKKKTLIITISFWHQNASNNLCDKKKDSDAFIWSTAILMVQLYTVLLLGKQRTWQIYPKKMMILVIILSNILIKQWIIVCIELIYYLDIYIYILIYIRIW